jgi:hypothetical protein
VSAGSPPISVAFFGPTAHQISVYCAVTATIPATATVRLWYRVQGTSAWRDGGKLYRSLPAKSGLAGAVEFFGGMVLGARPGTSYEVRLDYSVPGSSTLSAFANTTTRALPAPAGIPTITASPATLASILSQRLPAGTVLYLPNGIYTLPAGASIYPQGTEAQPVRVVGQSNTGVILKRTWATSGQEEWMLKLQGSHIIIDNIGFEGSFVDSGSAARSRCLALWQPPLGTRYRNITIRNCRARGFDQFFNSANALDAGMIYNNDIGGNNPHSLIGVMSADGYFGQDGWNDTAIRMPGEGIEVFNNEFFGFGDTFKCTDRNAGTSRAFFMHHNKVRYSADDGLGEADDSLGFCAFYDNDVYGAATLFSADTTYGGPIRVERNVGINIARHPYKLDGQQSGVSIRHNTLVLRGRMPGKETAIVMPSGTTSHNLEHAGNLYIDSTPGDAVKIDSWALFELNNHHNAYSKDSGFQFGGGPRSATMARAKIDRPALHATDMIATGQVLATPLTLDPNYTVQYVGHASVTLSSTSNARAAGVPIAGVTDGFTGTAPNIGAMMDGVSRGVVGLLTP